MMQESSARLTSRREYDLAKPTTIMSSSDTPVIWCLIWTCFLHYSKHHLIGFGQKVVRDVERQLHTLQMFRNWHALPLHMPWNFNEQCCSLMMTHSAKRIMIFMKRRNHTMFSQSTIRRLKLFQIVNILGLYFSKVEICILKTSNMTETDGWCALKCRDLYYMHHIE